MFHESRFLSSLSFTYVVLNTLCVLITFTFNVIYRTTDFLFVGFVLRTNKQLSESAVGLETHIDLMIFEKFVSSTRICLSNME